MSLSAQQLDKGVLRNYITPKEKKVAKKNHHRKQRRKAKEDKEYVPKYNRYDGWAV